MFLRDFHLYKSLYYSDLEYLFEGSNKGCIHTWVHGHTHNNKDIEFFLPKDSGLRSDSSEMIRPCWNGKGYFDNLEQYISSLQYTYWLGLMQSNEYGVDDIMNEFSKEMIKEIIGIANDFEISRFSHNSFQNNQTEINYEFYF